MVGWRVPRMWEDGECWIIGGGPSMPRMFGVPEDIMAKVMLKELPLSAFSPYLSPIHEKHIIAVNAAFKLGRWIDVMFFGDGAYYWANKDALMEFPNLKVTCNANLYKRPGVYYVKYVPRDGNHALGLTRNTSMISWNKHSGGAAISLANRLGARRIFLLGFDMMLSPTQRQHWHTEYSAVKKPRRNPQLPFPKHLESFTPIANNARAMGIEIYNVNRDEWTAVKQFPIITLETALSMPKWKGKHEDE